MPLPGLSTSSLAELLDILPDAVLMVDGRGRVAYCNPAVTSLLGYEPQALAGQPLSVLLPPAMRERHEQLVARFRANGQSTMMGRRPVLSALHRSGRVVPVSISICNLALDNGDRVSVAVVHDVSALNTHLDRATAQAETDALTGLGNRLRLSRRMEGLLAAQHPFAVLFLDLKHFKPFNDRYGHEAGDQALRTVGKRLQAQVRDEDVVVRLGGDEFVVLLDGLNDERRLAELAQDVRRSVSQPMRIDAAGGVLAADIGGALRPRHGNSERDLIAAADRAMYLAKQSGEGYRLAGDGDR
jgi:diguanylate cyclase (GGDEF)-like protein/PAS domain S-box-containing protein